MWQLAKNGYWILALTICFLIIIKSTDYFYPDFSRGFLIGKKDVFSFYKVFLYAHITASPIAFLLGIFQFGFRRSKLHKILGKAYVLSILFFAAPAGFFMAWFAIGGVPSIVNFSLMAILWFVFTLKAYKSIWDGKIEEHRNFMIRSFILTNSAILIRLLSFVNNQFSIVDGTLGYILISWISWLPVLLVYELIQKTNQRIWSKY